MTLYIKMDNWNQLCDIVNVVHGSDLDIILDRLVNGIPEQEKEIKDLNDDISVLEDRIDNYLEQIQALKNENKIFKEKLAKYKEVSNDGFKTISQ